MSLIMIGIINRRFLRKVNEKKYKGTSVAVIDPIQFRGTSTFLSRLSRRLPSKNGSKTEVKNPNSQTNQSNIIMRTLIQNHTHHTPLSVSRVMFVACVCVFYKIHTRFRPPSDKKYFIRKIRRNISVMKFYSDLR